MDQLQIKDLEIFAIMVFSLVRRNWGRSLLFPQAYPMI